MAEPIAADEQTNYETFRDCLSEPVLKALAAPVHKERPKKKRLAKKSARSRTVGLFAGNRAKVDDDGASGDTAGGAVQADAEDLGEFIDYLSTLIFPALPVDLRTLSYPKYRDSPHLQDAYSTPFSAATYTALLYSIPPTAIDSLESYALLPASSDSTDQHNLLTPVLTSYASAVTAPPPIWATTRTTECELCERDWVPLTYHHLIPKSTHARVLKRGWHDEDDLNRVAWLCRACHSWVHRLASNEELAKSWYTVDLILQGGVDGDVERQKEVEAWVKWVGGVRWKSR
jgi:hypothetical protein